MLVSVTHWPNGPTTVPRPAGPHPASGLVRVRELSAITVLVTALGEIDAANANDLSGQIERHLTGYHQLVLDLSRLEFFGTAGYSVLHRVRSRCGRVGTHWVLVPGPEVQRLLRVCDPDEALPTAPNIVSAVAALTRSQTARLS